MTFHGPEGLFLAAARAIALVIVVESGPVSGQVTLDGNILSSGWLVLGPFSTEYASTFLNNEFLLPSLNPSLIQYLTPEDGDEIAYNEDQAASTLSTYMGPRPNGRPIWRPFQNMNSSTVLDFQEDSASVDGPLDYAMSYAATYFEFLGDEEIMVNLCVGSDDGVQVWLDSELVHTLNTDRDQQRLCTDLVALKVAPGSHRIVLAVWDYVQEWSGSLGFFDQDFQAISESDPKWRFWGKRKPSGFSLLNGGLLRREIRSTLDTQNCPVLRGSGPLQVTIKGEQFPDGPDFPIFEETISGSFGPEKVTLEPGTTVVPAVSARIPAPVSGVGDFAGSYVFVAFPDCPTGNGAVEFDNGSYILRSIGWDLALFADNCTFVFNRIEGDFEITAHIKDVKWVSNSVYGEIGLMARQDLTERSRYATVPIVGEQPAHFSNDFEFRGTHGGRDFNYLTPLGSNVHHDWLKLIRVGQRLEGQSAPSLPDGSAGSFARLGGTCWIDAPEDMLVGLFVHSQTGNCREGFAEGTFDQIEIKGKMIPLDPNPPVGVEITWRNLSRQVLRDGLAYSLLIDPADGVATFEGKAVDDKGSGFPVFGNGEGIPLPGILDFGPFNDPNFTHAHDIGFNPGLGSAQSPDPGRLVISASGKESGYIANQDSLGGDRLFYAYREATGDFSARVSILDRKLPLQPPIFPAFGIMARRDCSAQARFSFSQDVGLGPQGGSTFDGRRAQGGYVNFNGPFAPFPFPGQHANHLRLDRCGNVFKGYVLSEPDPSDPTKGTFGGSPGEWVLLGEEDWIDDATPSVNVGLAVSSHLNCELATITFENWRLYPACGEPPAPRFVRGDADSDGQVSLTDVIRVLGYLFLAGAAPECMDAADADDSGFGQLDLTDPIVILGWLFLADPAPPPPSPTQADYPGADCGIDPTPNDGMDCHLPAGNCK